MNEDAKAKFRAENIGFIFQSFRLIPHLTAKENVQIPLEILGASTKSSQRAEELLRKVGLSHRIYHKASQLSGGEQQRVAIARAFVTRPKILFADEPTGNLDSENGNQILDLMSALRKEEQSTLVIVTHDLDLAAKAEMQLHLKDGELSTS
jgi:putative ABC transport system ATP-binding protein